MTWERYRGPVPGPHGPFTDHSTKTDNGRIFMNLYKWFETIYECLQGNSVNSFLGIKKTSTNN